MARAAAGHARGVPRHRHRQRSSARSRPWRGRAAAVMALSKQARLVSRRPEGNSGAAAPRASPPTEAAQNAAQAGEMVPTFGLGIPGSGAIGRSPSAALLMHGFISPTRLLIHRGRRNCSTPPSPASSWPRSCSPWSAGSSPACLLRLVTFDRVPRSCRRPVPDHGRHLFDRPVGLRRGPPHPLRRDRLLHAALRLFDRRVPPSPSSSATGWSLNLRAGLLPHGGRLRRPFLSRPWTATILTISIVLLVYGAGEHVASSPGARPPNTQGPLRGPSHPRPPAAAD